MEFVDVFQRSEIKFLLSPQKYVAVRKVVDAHAVPDKFYKSSIRNVYFDTTNFLLIRRSLEKPIFKEKLRIRSYQKLSQDDEIFVELKRKCNSVVYKRRVAMTENDFESLQAGTYEIKNQKENEIKYFFDIYNSLQPKMFISYEREALVTTDETRMRITFDKNILWRLDNLSLEADVGGNNLLQDGWVLMELKTLSSLPLWMVEVLSQEKIFKTSFSKYGMAYVQMKNMIYANEEVADLKTQNNLSSFEIENNGIKLGELAGVEG